MFKNLSPSALGITGHESEIIELALTYGFKGMELDVADFGNRVKRRDMAYARRLIDSAKIRVGYFQIPLNWEADEEQFDKELGNLPDYAEAAAEVGCTRCIATIASAGDERPYHENFEFHRGRFERICEALKPSGVCFGAAFQAAEYLRKDRAFQFIHDFDALTLLINMVGAANMGLLLDPWDLVAGGGSLESINSLPLEQIVAVQVAEMPPDVPLSELDKKSRLLPGAENGRIGVAAVLRALAERGYDGPVTVKPSRGIFESRRREVIVRETGGSLSKVWRAAGLTPDGKLGAMPEPVEPEPPAAEETTETAEATEAAES